MNAYVMEAEIEASRLERQAFQGHYSIIEELRGFRFRPDERVMDAGCGTGVLSRHLVEAFGVKQVDAVDASDLRLRQGTELLTPATRDAVRFHRQDLSRLDREFHGKYDTVICRFVIEHSREPGAILRELRKALKPGGRVVVIELDGVFLNLYSDDPELTEGMAMVRRNLDFDLEIGRKVPCLLKRAGFAGIEWDAKLLAFRGETLLEEYENNQRRFAAIEPFLLKVFGSREKAARFRELYLREMMKEESTTVFTKYVVTGNRE